MITSEDIRTSSVPVEGGESYTRASLCLDCVVSCTLHGTELAERLGKGDILEKVYGEMSENASRALDLVYRYARDWAELEEIESFLLPIIDATRVK